MEVFNDVISGKTSERPGMEALIEHLKSVDGGTYVVVVDDITRFARDMKAHTSLREQITSCRALLESPHLKFGHDAGTLLIENIFAAIAEHDRLKNAEQSKSRTIARLLNGFWVFKAPRGYKYVKGTRGGRVRVRDEPVAKLVVEALAGFASGRFQTQAEVKRFLDSKPEYPKDYRNGKEVRFDGVTRLLTSKIYAGFLEKPEWGVPLTRGEHEPLISLETFTRIQDRLAERCVAPARKDIDADFPLRGFLVCATCGGGMTSCWSQSHTGRKYPYYLCKHRGCSERDKSIGRDAVEDQFDAILRKRCGRPVVSA